MPGNVPVLNDIVQIRVTCSEGNQISQNVLHYLVGGVTGGGLTQLQMATAFQNVVSPSYRQLMPVTAFFEGVSVQNLSPPMAVAASTNLTRPCTRNSSTITSCITMVLRRKERFCDRDYGLVPAG